MCLVERLRELDALKLGAMATRRGRRDIIKRLVKNSSLLQGACRVNGAQPIRDAVEPLLALNRQLATDRTSCIGEVFQKITKGPCKGLQDLVPVSIPLKKLMAKGGRFPKWQMESLTEVFDQYFAWKDTASSAGFFFPALVILLLLFLGHLTPIGVLSTVSFFAILFLVWNVGTFIGRNVRVAIEGRLNIVDRVEKDVAYLDECIRDAFHSSKSYHSSSRR